MKIQNCYSGVYISLCCKQNTFTFDQTNLLWQSETNTKTFVWVNWYFASHRGYKHRSFISLIQQLDVTRQHVLDESISSDTHHPH